MTRDCSACKHRGNDLEDRFCGHPEALKVSLFGQSFHAMHQNGLCTTRGAQLFEHDCTNCDASRRVIDRLTRELEALRAEHDRRVTELIRAVNREVENRRGLAAVLRKVAKHVRHFLPYAHWTVGPESPGHHPTMPSAIGHLEVVEPVVTKALGSIQR